MTNLAVRMAEAVKTVGARSVYGEPLELDGITLVPVALTQYGFGGGGGDDSGDGGGGGGGCSVPIGAYVRDRNGLRFEPNPIALLAVAIPFLWVAGRAGARLIRALKR
ncbi:MAG: hypothetical protein ABI255_05510 [Microbacteriaceae bacterium]